MSLVRVVVRDGNLAKALQVFKKKVQRSGHLDELKKRKEYLKPSVVKHAMNQTIKHKRKRMQEME